MRKQRDSRGGSRGGGRAEAEVEVDAGVESAPEAEGGCHIRHLSRIVRSTLSQRLNCFSQRFKIVLND